MPRIRHCCGYKSWRRAARWRRRPMRGSTSTSTATRAPTPLRSANNRALLFIFALYEGKNEQQYDHTVPLYQHRAIGIQQLDWHNPSNEPKYIPLTGIGLVTT